MTDDDIRSMLQAKAREATVSDDAWAKIAVRLGTADAPVRHLPRRLATVAAAAAVVAGTVIVANLPTSQVATTTTTTSAGPTVGQRGIEPAVSAWLEARVPNTVEVGMPHVTVNSDATATVRFTGGQLATELFLQQLSGQRGWGVVSASSDLLLLDNPTYDGHEIVAELTPSVIGHMVVTYLVGTEELAGADRQVGHDVQHLGYPLEGAEGVSVRVVLTTEDGTTAIVEEPAQVLRDPATVTGSYVAVWPATDAVGLATRQQQADNGRAADLLDPQAVAGYALTELLPQGETSTSYRLGDFQLGDPNSGEVPYTLSDGSSGVVQLRRTAGDNSKIWYATGVTTDALEVLQYRHEANALVIDVQSTVDGTLTMAGAAPIEVKAGQKVSISRPAQDAIQTGAPVELRLRVGKKTLAVLADLPR